MNRRTDGQQVQTGEQEDRQLAAGVCYSNTRNRAELSPRIAESFSGVAPDACAKWLDERQPGLSPSQVSGVPCFVGPGERIRLFLSTCPGLLGMGVVHPCAPVAHCVLRQSLTRQRWIGGPCQMVATQRSDYPPSLNSLEASYKMESPRAKQRLLFYTAQSDIVQGTVDLSRCAWE